MPDEVLYPCLILACLPVGEFQRQHLCGGLWSALGEKDSLGFVLCCTCPALGRWMWEDMLCVGILELFKISWGSWVGRFSRGTACALVTGRWVRDAADSYSCPLTIWPEPAPQSWGWVVLWNWLSLAGGCCHHAGLRCGFCQHNTQGSLFPFHVSSLLHKFFSKPFLRNCWTCNFTTLFSCKEKAWRIFVFPGGQWCSLQVVC